jgi:hypothetical protein
MDGNPKDASPADLCLQCYSREQGPLCMDELGRRDYRALAAAYLKSELTDQRLIGHQAAFECVWTLAMDRPEEALDFILVALDFAETERQEAYLAAGALESLLQRHGTAIIDRLLRAAGQDQKLRRCLAGVWGRSAIDRAVRARIDAYLAPPVAPKSRRRRR